MFSGTNDYINKIFTVGCVSEDIQGISYDFQLYFDPLRADVRNTVDYFFKESQTGFEKDIVTKVGKKK